jgi:mannose-1-phosphate guanylyltransferase/mannose-1-phosphate guanylyltransferase/mannose-6-phosphate isomerase
MDFESREFWVEREDETVLPPVTLEGGAVVRAQDGARECGTVVPVILSGGCGSRLWPYSTEDTPKQFLSFTGAKSLFQMTLERVRDRNRFAAPVVVGNLRHASLCERELTGQDEGAQLLLEPCARNTAAAIAMAALAVRESHGDDALLLIMPSDHVIQDIACFHSAVATGEVAAREGRLVTFGIQPTAPETGFGYIEVGEDLPASAGVKKVLRFVEKPPLETAEKMVADGNHVWNAGIFLFRAGTFLDEVRIHAPEIAAATELALARARRDGNRIVPDAAALGQAPSESVDYAVMEHSSLVSVVPMSPGWSDLGSWDALAELVAQPEPLGPITAVDCDDCYIRSDGLQVAALGVRDLIIVASGQRLLILPRGRSQEVKKLLSAMDTIAA